MRTFSVVTEKRFCKETGQRPCHDKPFGYVIQIKPPIVSFQRSADVEGVGLVHFSQPKRREAHTAGWFKHKADAERRLPEVQRSPYLNRPDETLPVKS